MTSIDYRNEFIKVIKDKKYYIDNLGVQEFPISTKIFSSPDKQFEYLNECVNRILFDPNLPQKELEYFSSIIEEYLKDFYNTQINRSKLLLQNNTIVMLEDYDTKGQTGTCEKIEITTLSDGNLRIIESYSQTKYNACKELINGINKKFDMKPEKSFKKISLNLSVDEISLFSRLLVEAGVIDIPPKKNAEFYRFVAATFSSKERDNISPNSVKNNFLTFNDSTINSLKILLGNLKSHLDDLGK